MRILVANKFWYRRAGLERVMFDEISWLEAAGHEVAHFSATHPENDPSPWSAYFVPYLEIGIDASTTCVRMATAAARMFWSFEAARRFARLLRDFRPDIVHVHGIHRQLSPSILAEARRARVPVVQSLHDYHPICPADDLLLGGERACEPPRCGPVNVAPCALYHCVQHSRAKSALSACELLWRRWIVRYELLVDAFISPSHYLARTVTNGGLRTRPVHILPNAVPTPEASEWRARRRHVRLCRPSLARKGFDDAAEGRGARRRATHGGRRRTFARPSRQRGAAGRRVPGPHRGRRGRMSCWLTPGRPSSRLNGRRTHRWPCWSRWRLAAR